MILENNKSAKDYISEAYSQELKAIQDKAKLMETPADIIAKENIEKTIALSEDVLSMNILNTEITNEYNDLNEKIQAKKDEIAKLYGIEIFTDSLQAVKNAYTIVSKGFSEYLQTANDEFGIQQQQQFDEVQAKVEEDGKAVDTQVEAILNEANTLLANNKQESQREQAEYDYTLKRTRKQASEERAKVMLEREKAMQLKESEVEERKQACEDKLQEIAELQAKVDDIPNLLEQATLEGAELKEKELGKDYGYKSAMSKKDFDNEIARLQNDYDRLQSKFTQLCNEKKSLSDKLDKCYAESRQLATDTVKSTGGINILNSDNYGQNGKK
jgi:chromosome segregation ATPase